jgi:hypothetical protein
VDRLPRGRVDHDHLERLRRAVQPPDPGQFDDQRPGEPGRADHHHPGRPVLVGRRTAAAEQRVRGELVPVEEVDDQPVVVVPAESPGLQREAELRVVHLDVHAQHGPPAQFRDGQHDGQVVRGVAGAHVQRLGALDPGAAQQAGAGRVARHEQQAPAAGGTFLRSDHPDHPPPALGHPGGERVGDQALAADDHMTAGPPGTEPGQLRGEQQPDRLHHGVHGHGGGEEARDLQRGRQGAPVVQRRRAQDEQLQRVVQPVPQVVRELVLIGEELTHAGVAEHHRRGGQHREQQAPGHGGGAGPSVPVVLSRHSHPRRHRP